MLRSLALLLAFALGLAHVTTAVAAPASALTPEQCMAQIRGGQSERIECYAEFETDAATQAELARQTFDMVKKARCGGTIRVPRAALFGALVGNGALQLDPHDILCSVTTGGGSESQVTLTVAPKVQFQAGRIADISPGLIGISNLPELLVLPLRSVAESDFVRGQLTNALNLYLEQALRK
jgi:hypothetical protein